ncbi:MAG TPA: NlpC/P60 family protein [Fimbriimonadaceae bacterium]|nr:NlpC/P60 family protein [Fimbriimonadaceae bacterium]
MLAALCLALATYSQPVTALSGYNGAVYVGRADGAVQRVGTDFRPQATYAKPSGDRVSFVTASVYGVAWLTGPGGAIREKAKPGKVAGQTLAIYSGGKTYAVLIQPTAPVRRLAWLENRVAVCYDLGSTFYDPRGNVVAPSTFMPPDAAKLVGGSSLWVREQEDGTEVALFARPYSVRRDPRNQKAPLVSLMTAYQVGAWQWLNLGGFASNAFDAFPDGEVNATEDGRLVGDTKFLVLSDRVGLAADGIVAREPDSIVNVPIFTKDWEIGRLDAATVPGDSLWFGAGGDLVWWWTGGALVSQNRRSGQVSLYLPWGDPEMKVSSFVTDSTGIWIGSNHGLRRLDPASPDAALGYAGFLKAVYGQEATSSADPNAKKLTDAVFAWRFAGADKAGEDGGRMIASVYSVIGLQLPQTAAQLSSAGTQVTDELRFGDVLLSDKAAAIYLGNGITVEVRDGRVQNGDIWAFPRAVVRRFAP